MHQDEVFELKNFMNDETNRDVLKCRVFFWNTIGLDACRNVKAEMFVWIGIATVGMTWLALRIRRSMSHQKNGRHQVRPGLIENE